MAGKKSDIRPTAQSSGKKAGTATTQPVQLSKGSGYEFIHAWTSLKGVKSVTPYLELLRQVQASDLTTVLSNKLDGDMLKTMIQCVGSLVQSGEYDQGYSYLHNLTTVQRFFMVVMFMSADDKKYLKEVISKLQSHSSSAYDASNLSNLQKIYEL